MTDAVDVVNAAVAYTCACFAAVSVVVNVIILKILYSGRRYPYTSNYFYVIYMVFPSFLFYYFFEYQWLQIGSGIDIFSLVANHTLAVLPSRGWCLSIFLSSTLPGRVSAILWTKVASSDNTPYYLTLIPHFPWEWAAAKAINGVLDMVEHP